MIKHVPRKVKDKYDILGVIGEGAYGVVLKARKKESNRVVAIKYFKQTPGYCSDLDVIERELNILQSLRFENVVELIEWFRDKKRCFLVFEYVESNMLRVLQEHPEGLPLEEVRHLSYQLFSAIHWCHTHDIIHRDIKPENLLISKHFVLKLCDFGFARFCNTQTSADYYTNYVATRWYRSPELLIGSAYGKPVDIWACGCIMAEFATGQALFAGESDIDQLYRIQKTLGPLPIKYLEDMIRNPKFEGLKFPSIHHFEPLEPRFSHMFPADMMHIFKNTLRLCGADRFTAEQCIQQDAFIYLKQKRSQQRPKTAYGISDIPMDHNSEAIQHTTPLIDGRLSRSYDAMNEVQLRHRSLSITNHNSTDHLTDLSLGSSSFTMEKSKYRSNPQLPDRSVSFNHHRPKIIRTRTKTYSTSTDEEEQPTTFSPRTANERSHNDNESTSNLLRKTYLQSYQSTPSVREQQIPASKYASNEVLLRPKQQQHLINLAPTASKDMSKRFSLDQNQIRSSSQQHIAEPFIYRSSMIIVPEHNSNVHPAQTNNNQNSSLPSKQTREEPIKELHQQRSNTREFKRDLSRSQSVNYHSSAIATTPLSRTPSRQSHHQTVPDLLNEVDHSSTVSSSYQASRSFEQTHNNLLSRNSDHRRHGYGSDSHLMSSSGYNSSLTRPSFSSAKNDYALMNKNAMAPERDSNYDSTKATKVPTKQNVPVYPKTPSDTNRRQQSSNSLFGVYPLARTAILHVANALMPSSHQRQSSFRVSNTPSRHHDH